MLRDIKSLSWRRLFAQEPGIWMPRFDDLAIYTEKQFRTKLNYIHNNPVKAGLVSKVTEYEFSSAVDWLQGRRSGSVVTDVSIVWPSGRDS